MKFRKWHYKVVQKFGADVDPRGQERDLDAFGAAGWEFCGTDEYGRFVFKREGPAPEKSGVVKIPKWVPSYAPPAASEPEGE